MFNGLHHHPSPSDAELASATLTEETSCRFPSFNTTDAVTLGLSIRKRFRGSSRHTKSGRGLVISIQTIAGHTLFACTVGDLGAPGSLGDVSLDSWACVEGMINVVRRTGHSSYYVEKGIGAMGKTPKDMGIRSDYTVNGGAFPIWLQNSPCCPIAVIAAYGGSSYDDHRLVVNVVKDYLSRMSKGKDGDLESTEWVRQPAAAALVVNPDSPFEPDDFGD